MEGLVEICKSNGLGKICIHYADFISLACVSTVKEEIRLIREDTQIAVVVLNPWVAREKMRLARNLKALSARLAKLCQTLEEEEEGLSSRLAMLHQTPLKEEGDKTQQVLPLKHLISGLVMERDRAGKRACALMRKKQRCLDHLILLELKRDAPARARAEGRWLLRHHKSGSYNFAHVGDKVSPNLLEVIRGQMEERRGDNGGPPSPANLLKVRRNVLRSFGRFHLESKLHQVLKQVCILLDQYLKQLVSKDHVCQLVMSQRQIINNLMIKRSLIGCRLINLDDPIGWEYDIESNSEDENYAGNKGDTDDSDSGLEHEDEDEDEHEQDTSQEEDDEWMEEDENLADDTDEDDDEQFLYGELNHAAHQAPYIWPEELGNVMSTEDVTKCHAGQISSRNDVSDSVHCFDSPKGLEKGTEAEVEEESPISASSIVSTNSEIADVDVAHFVAKYDNKETQELAKDENGKVINSKEIAKENVKNDSEAPAGPRAAHGAAVSACAAKNVLSHHEDTKECRRSCNVSTVVALADSKLEKPEDDMHQLRRSTRKIKRNVKYDGPEWTK